MKIVSYIYIANIYIGRQRGQIGRAVGVGGMAYSLLCQSQEHLGISELMFAEEGT